MIFNRMHSVEFIHYSQSLFYKELPIGLNGKTICHDRIVFFEGLPSKNCFSAKKGKPLLSCQVLIFMKLSHLLRPKLLVEVICSIFW